MEILVTLSGVEYLPLIKDRGADGVIVGLKKYSDRMNRIFSIAEFDNIFNRCKELGLKIFVNVNNVFEEDELDNLKVFLFSLKEYEIDGIIYNDMAVLYLSKILKMEKKLIFHPDTLMTNSNDISVVKALGVSDVILSKDITLDEINEIVSKVGLVSMLIFGHLNLSYSKRKFLKNYFEHIGSDINYHFEKLSLREESRDYKLPIKETSRGTSIYTDYIFETFNQIKDLRNVLNYGIIDDINCPFEEILEIITYFKNVDNYMENFDAEDYFAKKFSHNTYSSGFLFRKTASKKELLDEKN